MNNQERVSRRGFVATGGILGSVAAVNLLAAGESKGVETTAAESSSPTPTVMATPSLSGACPPLQISGVFPDLTVSSSLVGPRSECGIGAVVPWADRLWLISYVAHTGRTGGGTGLYEIDKSFTLRKRPESVTGTYANRLVHAPTTQLIIGPHIIDADCKVRTFPDLVDHRLTATMTHRENPANMVYFLGMEGEFWEADVRTLRVKQLFDLKRELEVPAHSWPHFKGGYTGADRVVVANNTYSEKDDLEGVSTGGRLAEWDGKQWKTLERTAFCDVQGRSSPGDAEILATGWDRSSVILKVFTKKQWTTYRLPMGSHCYNHGWYTEWPRIREVETERFLMNMHGIFYELPRIAYGGRLWGIKPICQYLRMIPDFCSWRGLLVLAGDQTASTGGNLLVGEPHSNLWFGKIDDLWQFGKPQGWGGPWRESQVEAGRPSDPFLMTGFDKKCFHLTQTGTQTVEFAVEIDFLGNGSWMPYQKLEVPAGGYTHHEFPAGFAAHWVRLIPAKACQATAQFVYT